MAGQTTGDAGAPLDAARLTTGIRRGDRGAFAVVYEAYFERVLGLAKRISGRDEAFCLDVVQETMMRAIRAIPVIEEEAALWAWLARATRSVVVDLVRMDLRRKARERAAVGQPASTKIEADEELAAWVRERLAMLDTEEERLLREHVVRGRTLAEFAAGEGRGVSRHAVYGKVRRVLKGLRRRAREAFGDE